MSPTFSRPAATTIRCQSVASLLLVVAVGFQSGAQEPAAKPPIPSVQEWLEQRRQEFQSYRFSSESSPTIALTMEPQPLLHWSNAERGTRFGAAFLWSHDGRPVVIANAYGRGASLRHEFQSLCEEPIVAERGGSRIHRFRAGIEWRELPDSPEAAASRPLRVAQMRRLAERFRVTVITPLLADTQPAELRLLPQPVYRSPASSAHEIAVFVFVQGTDPECVLLLETTAEKKWRYSLARQTRGRLVAELDGQPLFDLAAVAQSPADPESVFTTILPPEAR
jgi:hypothetical protein